jgi:hypothetical protein
LLVALVTESTVVVVVVASQPVVAIRLWVVCQGLLSTA